MFLIYCVTPKSNTYAIKTLAKGLQKKSLTEPIILLHFYHAQQLFLTESYISSSQYQEWDGFIRQKQPDECYDFLIKTFKLMRSYFHFFHVIGQKFKVLSSISNYIIKFVFPITSYQSECFDFVSEITLWNISLKYHKTSGRPISIVWMVAYYLKITRVTSYHFSTHTLFWTNQTRLV